MYQFKLAVGPLSPQIIEGVFQYSAEMKEPLALIASKNQIDYDSGYVCLTSEFMERIRGLRDIYPTAQVTICRDHCGPGFKSAPVADPIEDVYETIKTDIENGFDLIHIDFSKLPGTNGEQMVETICAIHYALSLKPDIGLEIGTDEITDGLPDLARVEEDIKRIKEICNPVFYVVNTGSLTLENRQVGVFDAEFASKAASIVHQYGMKLKEHNADYLDVDQIQLRDGIVDAMNIAPELGVTQTKLSMKLDDLHDWARRVYAGKQWKKWLLPDRFGTAPYELCIEAAGHYHFNDPFYRWRVTKMGSQPLIDATKEVLHRYSARLPIIYKPWGYEEIIALRDGYMVKWLFMKAGHQCSLQKHTDKEETFILVGGQMEFEHEGRVYQLRPRQSATIKPGEVHRMRAITDIRYMECSTPHPDDVVRLQDDYQRA